MFYPIHILCHLYYTSAYTYYHLIGLYVFLMMLTSLNNKLAKYIIKALVFY